MDTAARWRELLERVERVAWDLQRASQHIQELAVVAKKLEEESRV